MRGAEIRINNLGFRGPDRTLAKARGTYRIAVLGNSITFGSGVAIEDAWTTVLEDLLNDRVGGVDSSEVQQYEVLNLAMTQTWSCFDRHIQRALYFKPDLILWSISRQAKQVLCETNIRTAANLAKVRSIPFYAFSIGDNTYRTKRSGTRFFELLPPLGIEWGPEHQIYPQDQHPNAVIHGQIASALLKRLTQREKKRAALVVGAAPNLKSSWSPPEPVPSRGDDIMLENVRQTGFWTSRLWHRLKDRWRSTRRRLNRKLA